MSDLFGNMFDINGNGQIDSGERMMGYALFQHMADAGEDEEDDAYFESEILDSDESDDLDNSYELDDDLKETLDALDNDGIEPLNEIHYKLDGFEF